MSLSGRLREYSLPEVFKMIEAGQKSGLLNIRIFNHATSTFVKHCVWVDRGAIVGLSQNLDGQDLITWLSSSSIVDPTHHAAIRRIPAELNGAGSLGDYLKQQNWVDATQLQTIFEQVVVQPIWALFGVGEGFFTFNRGFTVPKTELTGIRLMATQMNLRGLQQLNDWTHLETKFPEPTAGILQTDNATHRSDLSAIEQAVLSHGNGKVSLQQTADLVQQPIAIVQQIAFRLIAAGLAEELPMIVAPAEASNKGTDVPHPNAQATPTTAVSATFLNQLSSFFQKRAQSPQSSPEAEIPPARSPVSVESRP